MQLNEKVIEVMNDLIQINNDRVVGYVKAASMTTDADLLNIFNRMASSSRQYVLELSQFVKSEGEQPAEGTTLKGKIYRAWMDIKTAVTGEDRKTILASCEFGEDAAQNAYEDALSIEDLPQEIRQLLVNQKLSLRAAHDKIKTLEEVATPDN